jgi:hypothetical protein
MVARSIEIWTLCDHNILQNESVNVVLLLVSLGTGKEPLEGTFLLLHYSYATTNLLITSATLPRLSV